MMKKTKLSILDIPSVPKAWTKLPGRRHGEGADC